MIIDGTDFLAIYCDNCNEIRPLSVDMMRANAHEPPLNPHDAVDLICKHCRIIVATLHERVERKGAEGE